MKTEHIVLGGLLAGATYLAFDKKALNKTKKAVGLSDKGSSKRRVKIKGTDFKRVTSDVYGNPRYVIHYVNLKPDGEYGTKYEDILALNKKLSLGGRKYHNKQYGGGLVFQSYNIEDTAKELTKDLNAYYNSSTNGLSDKGGVKAPKFKKGDQVYSWGNPTNKGRIVRVLISDDSKYEHGYLIEYKRVKNGQLITRQICESSIFKTKKKPEESDKFITAFNTFVEEEQLKAPSYWKKERCFRT
jgi:hypothetical protein